MSFDLNFPYVKFLVSDKKGTHAHNESLHAHNESLHAHNHPSHYDTMTRMIGDLVIYF